MATAELLFDHAMREALACGRQMVTLGLAPLAGGVRAPLRFARRAGSDLFNFEGLYAFKAKAAAVALDAVTVVPAWDLGRTSGGGCAYRVRARRSAALRRRDDRARTCPDL